MMKFQMSTCDAGDGIFKSYLTNISTEHSLIHNYKRVVTLSVIILDYSEREMISQEVFSCIIFHATTYHMVVFRPDIFSPYYM